MRAGRFFAVGIGPGDPELLTVKAISVLRRAHAIYHAGAAADRGRALETIRGYLRSEQAVCAIRSEPMTSVGASDAYGRCVDAIAAECRAGRDAVFITGGDPTLYSTAAQVWQLLMQRHPEIAVEIVPGITSITAAAARVRWPLAQRDESIAIVPAAYHAAKLPELLGTFDTLCLLKPARSLPALEKALRARPTQEAVYAENVTTPKEWIAPNLAAAVGREEYFSLVLVRHKPGERNGERPPATRAGRVWVVGLGPGDPDLLTVRARRILETVDVVLGYDGYLRLLEPLRLSAEMRPSPIGEENARAREALAQARAGRNVALISSGDAGIYGMASLLLEADEPESGVEIEIVPGVTAATSAAALLGAPLGHDFACISLSDLLTPWDVIEARLDAAGQADFVVAMYNPVSQRRTWQLLRARDILLKHRGPDTPVGLVDGAYRPGCRVWQTTLGGLTTDGVSMTTTIIIGNGTTRIINGRVVTPRKYDLRARSASKGCSEPPSLALRAGREILQQSFAIIERELGPHDFPLWAFAVVRRMIHASADFEFAQTLRYSGDFEAAIRSALRARQTILTDTEMVRIGIRSALRDVSGLGSACLLNHWETSELATSASLTRSAAGIRLAARQYRLPIVVIGNAPTALDEALRLIEEENWRPAAIIGLPVGFIGVEEAKSRLLEQSKVPYLTCIGRKGGSAVAAAAVNALVELFGRSSDG